MGDSFDKWGRSTGDGGSASYDKWGRPVGHSSGGGGGGGIFGSIEHFVGEHGGNTVADILGNAAGQAGGIVSGIPNALVGTGEAAWQDFAHPNPRNKRLNSWSYLFEHPIGYAESYLHDPKTFGGKVIEPQVKATSTDVSALRRGDWHYFEKHPLNPVLDIATVASLGGKGLLVGARTGALGDRAAELANSERLLQVGNRAEALNQAKTLQGRIRQKIFDDYSMAHPDMAVVGANVRMKRILNGRAATLTIRAGVPVRPFQRIVDGLTPAETFAFHVAAEGVPLEDRVAYYQAQLVERLAQLGGKRPKSVRPIEDYLKNLTSPAVRDALENPRPEFIDALQRGKEEIEGRAGQRLVDTGQLSEATRAERAALPQREMFGSERRQAAVDEAQQRLDAAQERLDQRLATPVEPGLFHGTRQRFEGDALGDIYSTGSGANNLYGHGFYTTDAHDIASTYTHKGGATESQHVYRVHWTGEGKPKVLDLDQPAHPTVKEWAQAQLKEADAGYFDVSTESYDALKQAIESGSSGEVIRAVRRMWGSTGEIPKSEVDDMVANLSDALSAQGFDGLKHVGGNLAGGGKRLHNVTIFFDTRKLKLSDAMPQPTEAETLALQEARAAFDKASADLRAPSMEANLVNPAFPAPFRFPHVGKRGNAGLFKSPQTNAMLGKVAPLSQLKHNAAVRLQNALFITDPHVLVADYLQTMRHETILQMQKEALDPISQPLTADHVGFKEPGEWYYRPSYDRKTTAPIPRHVREGEAISQDAALTSQSLGRDTLGATASGIVSKDLKTLGVDARDLHNLDKLNRLGIRRVPAAFGKEFSDQYGGTHWAVRYFYDRPMDVWRAITLNFRPAWLVNNFVGNAIMGLATYGPAGAAVYLRTLLATERGEDKVRTLWRWTVKHPTLRRKYGAVFQEVAPELHSAGLYGTQTKVTHLGVYESRIGKVFDNKAVRAAGFVPRQIGRMVMKVGRGITRAEILLAEDTGREAAFIREAGGDIARIRATAQKMGEGHLALMDALKRMDQQSIEQAVTRVNDALGDFNDLSHFERGWLRRFIPFYSWFKVITKVSGKYVARYPARVLLLRNIELAQSTKGEPALPAWLSGSILIGKPNKGVQTLISTQGLNPYETANQIATGGAGSVLSPFASAFIIGLTGRDPTFGGMQDYYGLGANTRGGWGGQLEMGGGALVSGLAPARLYTQSANYQGKLYAPQTYHVGPLALNDFILQYLGLPIRHVKVKEAKRERGLK